MAAVHATIGSIVILAFAINVIAYLVQLISRPIPAARYVSYAAAAAISVQVLLGITLLVQGHVNLTIHYVVGLLAMVPVGIEHSVARRGRTPRARIGASALAAAGALVLAVLAYLIGQGTIG